MRKKIFLLLSIILIAAGCQSQSPATTSGQQPAYNYSHHLQIGNHTLNVEIAKTSQAMEQGLSDRNSMADDSGMLFDFGDTKTVPDFWMKDMKFNLDFVWIADNRIVGVTSDIPKPDANCQSADCLPTYSPPAPVNWVLEVNSGWAEKNNIKVGDVAKLSD